MTSMYLTAILLKAGIFSKVGGHSN